MKNNILPFLVALIFCTSHLNAEDVEMDYVRTDRSFLAVQALWNIKTTRKLPSGKYWELTISYKLNDRLENASFILNCPIPPLASGNIDSVRFSVTTIEGLAPTLFIEGLRRGLKIYNYSRPLGSEKYNIIKFYFTSKVKLAAGKEVMLAKSFHTDPKNTKNGHTVQGICYAKEDKVLPLIEFKVSAKVVDSPEVYTLPRDFGDKLAGLKPQEQRAWLLKKRRERVKRYRMGLIPLGDLFAIQKEIVKHKIKTTVPHSSRKAAGKLYILEAPSK